MTDRKLLTEAVEQDKGDPITLAEVVALLVLAVSVGVFGVLTATVIWLWHESGWTWGLAGAAGFVVAGGVALVVGAARAIEGRRAWREARAYAPPPEAKPEPLAIAPPTPIIVKRLDGSSYVLPEADDPLLLPDGRKALDLNEDTLRAVLAEVIERHDGLWSRKRLMAITVNGKRVTRKLYETLTDGLSRSGFLQERKAGGFELPHDVKAIEDLDNYILTGQAGQTAGRQELPRKNSGKVGGRVGGAERARARWLKKEEVS